VPRGPADRCAGSGLLQHSEHACFPCIHHKRECGPSAVCVLRGGKRMAAASLALKLAATTTTYKARYDPTRL
jgi:hypothetical protein